MTDPGDTDTRPPHEPAGGARDPRRWERATDTGSIVWGFILIAIGGWFFIEHTLGYDLPRIDWGTVWPIVLIVIGGWIILRAAGRRSA
jgi:hypothetical protein